MSYILYLLFHANSFAQVQCRVAVGHKTPCKIIVITKNFKNPKVKDLVFECIHFIPRGYNRAPSNRGNMDPSQYLLAIERGQCKKCEDVCNGWIWKRDMAGWHLCT